MDDDRPADGAAALKRLMAGNRRYAAGEPANDGRDARRRQATSVGQQPFAVVLTCADSRLPAEIIFDQGIGDLFVVRVAGNTATAREVQGSVEFGITALKANLLMVLGHEDCGAAKAAVDAVVDGSTYPGQIGAFVDPIVPAARMAVGLPKDQQIAAAVAQNVRDQVALLEALGPIVQPAVAGGSLTIVGATYALASGVVTLLD
ncbi:MAG TPA: carbonic anhydrase [Acidimicrobiales bacterium]